jgi:hypothetical protein
MSKASRQSITILALVNGILKTIDHYNLAKELNATVLYTLDVCKDIVIRFPESGNKQKNLKWMTSKIEEANLILNRDNDPYTLICLVSLAHILITDLIERIKDPVKLNMLEPLEEAIYALSDMIDPEKDQFKAYEEADMILKEFYKILEF